MEDRLERDVLNRILDVQEAIRSDVTEIKVKLAKQETKMAVVGAAGGVVVSLILKHFGG